MTCRLTLEIVDDHEHGMCIVVVCSEHGPLSSLEPEGPGTPAEAWAMEQQHRRQVLQ